MVYYYSLQVMKIILKQWNIEPLLPTVTLCLICTIAVYIEPSPNP